MLMYCRTSLLRARVCIERPRLCRQFSDRTIRTFGRNGYLQRLASSSDGTPASSLSTPEELNPVVPESPVVPVTTESHPIPVGDAEDTEGTEAETPAGTDMFATKELFQELSDTAELGKRGEPWFLAQLLVFAMVMFPPMKLHGLVDLLSILAISAGVVFIAYALITMGKTLSPMPAPRKSGELKTSGMYGYVRHPMYAGLILLSFGLTFLTGSETRFALSCLLLWVLEQKANLEERLLEGVYPEYAAYKERVRKFFPYIY